MSNLYSIINSLCEAQGINTAEMCRRTGVRQQNISDLKNGRQDGLSAKNLSKIAAYFGVSVAYLLGTETKKAPTEDGEGITKEQIKIALFGGDAGDILDEDLDNAVQFALFSARERKQRGVNE